VTKIVPSFMHKPSLEERGIKSTNFSFSMAYGIQIMIFFKRRH